MSRSSGYSAEHKTSFAGPLWHLDKGKTWREVQASFVPATNKLVLDGTGLTVLLKEIETCRHDAVSPKGFEDYGMVVVLRDGRTIHLATYSGMEKYDWIERLTASAPPSLSLSSSGSAVSPKTSAMLMTPSRDSGRSASMSVATTPLSAQSAAAASAQVRKLAEENQQLRHQLDEQQGRVEALKLRLKEVTQGYKDELKHTIALKRELLEAQTQLSESEHEVRILRGELAKHGSE